MIFSVAIVFGVWSLTSAFIVVEATPLDFAWATRHSPNIRIEPRLAGEFRIRDCSSALQTTIEAAIEETQQIAEIAWERTEALWDLLADADDEEVDSSSWSALDLSTFDMFETIYGQLINQEIDGGIISEDRLSDVASIFGAFKSLSTALTNYQALSLDIYCDDNFLIQPGPDGTYEYLEDGSIDENKWYDDSGNNFGWIQTLAEYGVVKCNTPLNLNGACLNSPQGDDVSIVTMCLSKLEPTVALGKTMSDFQGITYTDDSTNLEQLLVETVSFLMLHELGHSTAAVGDKFMIDSTFPDPDNPNTLLTAYGWEYVCEIAATPEKAIINADSFAFYGSAMYLQKNTWWTGKSQEMTVLNSARAQAQALGDYIDGPGSEVGSEVGSD